MNLRRSSKKVDDHAIVAQRIKRLSSIILKLELHPQMKLSQMQDIGGCRVIVRNVDIVKQLVKIYDSSQIKHKRAATDDYITSPRASGYRGVHLVYRYFSDNDATAIYNDLKIEMQIRSRYQHAWATAVETVGTFVSQALKSSLGEENWLRFFALMGSAIALREKCPPIPGTPDNMYELTKEIKEHADSLDIVRRLPYYNQALRSMEDPKFTKKAHYYLLALMPSENIIYVTGYRRDQLASATQNYQDAEERARKTGGDAVLVSVESLGALRRAFPNYFADTTVFLELLTQTISGKARKISN